MAFNITDFRAAMQYDGQRPNLFEVTITNVGNFFQGKDLSFFAKATSIPGATIAKLVFLEIAID